MTSYPMDTDGCNTYNNSKEIQLQNRLGHTKHYEINLKKDSMTNYVIKIDDYNLL